MMKLIIQQPNFTKYLKANSMESKSEDKIALDRLTLEIVQLDSWIEGLEIQLTVKRAKLSLLKDRKKSMENYLNSDNN